MKQSPLKRKTPLKQKTKIGKVSKKQIQKNKHDDKLRDKLLERCKGLCEICHKPPDWRGLQLSHTTPKRMGGTIHIYTEDEVLMLCGKCHSNAMHNLREV